MCILHSPLFQIQSLFTELVIINVFRILLVSNVRVILMQVARSMHLLEPRSPLFFLSLFIPLHMPPLLDQKALSYLHLLDPLTSVASSLPCFQSYTNIHEHPWYMCISVYITFTLDQHPLPTIDRPWLSRYHNLLCIGLPCVTEYLDRFGHAYWDR